MRQQQSGIRAAFVCWTFLLILAFSLVFPSVWTWLINVLAESYNAARFPFLVAPYFIYALFGFYVLCKGRLFEVLRDEVQEELQKQQMASLTLAGFCFTSLGLLVSFFKEDIKAHLPGPQTILTFFAAALGSFIVSYMVLRYRGQRVYSLISDASIDNGLWCILAGLLLFCHTTPGLERLPVVFLFVLIAYALHVALNFYFYVRFLR
jgi:hypothetical protein